MQPCWFGCPVLAHPNKKGTLKRIQSAFSTSRTELFLAEDRVFGGFGDAEFHHLFGGDLDGGPGGGIASHAGLAIDEHELAQARLNASWVAGSNTLASTPSPMGTEVIT